MANDGNGDGVAVAVEFSRPTDRDSVACSHSMNSRCYLAISLHRDQWKDMCISDWAVPAPGSTTKWSARAGIFPPRDTLSYRLVCDDHEI